ncbi:MAG: ribosomal protein S18-alanine N-acetyltransferase [Clostridia bacterium]|nr:ribosomal protein S18-alanine N-acetyltransferase [Clostridia bacterium]
MKIRGWTQEDVKTIAAIEKRCFGDPWTEEMLGACMQYAWQQLFLAEEDGQVLGYGCLGVLFEDAEILNIAVDTPFRGRGIGETLLRAMHKKAKALGAQRVLLEVRVSNLPAIGLYEKLGYTRYGVREHYYEDGEDAFVMQAGLTE